MPQSLPQANGGRLPTEQPPSDQHDPDADVGASRQQRARLNRVLEYQCEVLQKENPLEAALGTINAGLMNIAVQLDETLVQALASSPRTVELIQPLLPSLQVHLQVVRQIDRLAQLELRLTDARHSPTAESNLIPAKPR